MQRHVRISTTTDLEPVVLTITQASYAKTFDAVVAGDEGARRTLYGLVAARVRSPIVRIELIRGEEVVATIER